VEGDESRKPRIVASPDEIANRRAQQRAYLASERIAIFEGQVRSLNYVISLLNDKKHDLEKIIAEERKIYETAKKAFPGVTNSDKR